MPNPLADPRLRRAALDPALIAWSVLQTLTLPVRKIKLLMRRLKRKGHRFGAFLPPDRPFDEAKTAAILARPSPHVVFRGPGLGEFVMLKRVADALLRLRPDSKVSFALRDRDAIDAVRTLYPSLNVSWISSDGYFHVLRWLASQRPDVLVFTESYRYPTLLQANGAFGSKAFFMNGRCRRRRSFDNPVSAFQFRWMFGKFAAMGMQSEAYARNVRPLVRPGCEVRVTGDIKTDVSVAPLRPEQQAGLDAWLASDLPLVCAGSTDNLAEERMVLDAFRMARAETPCRLLIAPRRSVDIEALYDLLREAGLSFKTRGAGDPAADVFVLDTQGELANAYRPCVAVYVGGSYLKRGGGHNVMEPLAWGLPVAFGPEPGHFEAIQKLVEERAIGTRVHDACELAAFWGGFLSSADERARAGEIAHRLVEESRGAVEKTVEMLVKSLGL